MRLFGLPKSFFLESIVVQGTTASGISTDITNTVLTYVTSSTNDNIYKVVKYNYYTWMIHTRRLLILWIVSGQKQFYAICKPHIQLHMQRQVYLTRPQQEYYVNRSFILAPTRSNSICEFYIFFYLSNVFRVMISYGLKSTPSAI